MREKPIASKRGRDGTPETDRGMERETAPESDIGKGKWRQMETEIEGQSPHQRERDE